MQRFYMMEIEKEQTEAYPCWGELNMDRETEYRVYGVRMDQYENESHILLASTPNYLCEEISTKL